MLSALDLAGQVLAIGGMQVLAASLQVLGAIAVLLLPVAVPVLAVAVVRARAERRARREVDDTLAMLARWQFDEELERLLAEGDERA